MYLARLSDAQESRYHLNNAPKKNSKTGTYYGARFTQTADKRPDISVLLLKSLNVGKELQATSCSLPFGLTLCVVQSRSLRLVRWGRSCVSSRSALIS